MRTPSRGFSLPVLTLVLTLCFSPVTTLFAQTAGEQGDTGLTEESPATQRRLSPIRDETRRRIHRAAPEPLPAGRVTRNYGQVVLSYREQTRSGDYATQAGFIANRVQQEGIASRARAFLDYENLTDDNVTSARFSGGLRAFSHVGQARMFAGLQLGVEYVAPKIRTQSFKGLLFGEIGVEVPVSTGLGLQMGITETKFFRSEFLDDEDVGAAFGGFTLYPEENAFVDVTLLQHPRDAADPYTEVRISFGGMQ